MLTVISVFPQPVCADAGLVRLSRPHLHRLRDARPQRVRLPGECRSALSECHLSVTSDIRVSSDSISDTHDTGLSY